MTILRDISMIWSLTHVLVLYTFLYESRFNKKKTIIYTVIAMVPWIMLNGGLYLYLGSEKMARVMLITATLPSLVFFFLMSRHRDGRFFFTFCFVDTVSYGVVVLTSIMDYYLFGNQFVFMFVSRMLLFPLMEFLTWHYLRDFYQSLQRAVKKGWGAFAIVSALFYVLLVMMSSYPVIFYNHPGQTGTLLLAVVLMVMMYLNVFQVLYLQQKSFYMMESERRLNQQAQTLHNELNAEQEYIFNAQRYRHDLHHHGKVVLAHLEQGEVEEAKEYLRKYREYLEEGGLRNYCHNLTANALLRITERRCIANGINFRFRGDIPKDLVLGEPGAGTVFGNLLENACEACEKCSNAYLHIKAETRQNVLYVEVKNSVDGKAAFEGDLPQSTKKGGGIGLRSINTVLARHDGMMTCRQEGNQFITRIILPL